MTRLLPDLNLVPSALRWWEKSGVGIIGKETSRSFVSPWVSDCHALVEGGTSVRLGGLLHPVLWGTDSKTINLLVN